MKAITTIILMAVSSLYAQGEDTLFIKYLSLTPTGVTYLGDQNSDGYDDILLYDCGNKKAQIFFGGNSIDTIPVFTINASVADIKTLDINYDGKEDIILSYFLETFGKIRVRVYYGGSLLDTIPDIEFGEPPGSTNWGIRIYTLKDFDGDERSELLITDYFPPYSSLPNGIFYFYKTYPELDTIPFTYIAGDSINNIRLDIVNNIPFSTGDLNGDGLTDFSIGGNYDTTDYYFFRRFYFGNENFDLTPAVTFNEYEHTTFNPQYMQIIKDVNGDGRDDILIQYNGDPYPYYYWDAILYGSNPIDTIPDVGLNTQNTQIDFQMPAVSVDYNQDGYNDFLVRAGAPLYEARLWYGRHDMNLNGYELPKRRWGGDFDFFGRLFARVGDVNGDSIEDYCIGRSGSGPSSCISGYIVIFKGDTLYKDTTTVFVGEIENLPETFELYEPYPNPFNPVTTIKYDLVEAGNIKLAVYDILGREITILVNEQHQPGKYEVQFNASNLASGVYIYTLTSGNYTSTKKLILLK